MPNLENAKKALRQSKARYEVNRRMKDRITRWLKKTVKAIEEKDKKVATTAYQFLTKLLDKAAKDKVVSENKASRVKSRVQTKLNTL